MWHPASSDFPVSVCCSIIPASKLCSPGRLVSGQGACFFRGAAEIESCRDPCQAGGILLHIAEFRDLRRGVAQEVGHLPEREGAAGSIRLFDAVDQIGGEGVAEGRKSPVAPVQPPPECGSIVPKVHRPGITSVFVGEAASCRSKSDRWAVIFSLAFNCWYQIRGRRAFGG